MKPTAFLVMAIALAFVAVFWPTLRWLAQAWLGHPYYSHGFLVPAIAVALAWRRWPNAWPVHPDWRGLILLAAALLLHLAALPLQMFVLSALALAAGIAGLTLYFGGLAVLSRLAFPIAFLLTAIPLPAMERLSPPLEAWVAGWASAGARLAGIQAEVVGAQVQIGGTAFVVGAPCSGLRSLAALLTVALLFVYLVDGRAWGKAVLLVAALPVALLANVVRVSSIFVVADAFGTDAGLRYYHDLSSPALFLLSFVGLVALAQVVKCGELRADL